MEEREQALERLPRTYAAALTLRDCGLDHAAIAQQLGIPTESIGPLLVLAERKVGRLLLQSPAGSEASPPQKLSTAPLTTAMDAVPMIPDDEESAKGVEMGNGVVQKGGLGSVRLEGRAVQRLTQLAADPSLHADATLLSTQEDGVVRYAHGQARAAAGQRPGLSPLGPGQVHLVSPVTADLREFFSDRVFSASTRLPAQPFNQAQVDTSTLTVDADKLVGTMVLHSWNNTTFSLSFSDHGEVLSAAGGAAGSAAAQAWYLLSIGEPQPAPK